MLRWDEIKGQSIAKGFLSHAVKSGRVPHAVLFTGPVGVGKFSTAMAFARRLNCLQPTDDGPCDACRSCQKIFTEQHPDVRVLLPTGAARLHKIADIRELQRSLVTRPFEGNFQILIIDEAERMTKEAANALLKTLEEPPRSVSIVLTSSKPAQLLDTILSRCQEVRFRRLTADDVGSIVATAHPDLPAALLARLSEGSPGRAFDFIEDDVLERRKKTLETIFSLDSRFPARTTDAANALAQEKKRGPQILEFLNLLLVDVAAVKAGAEIRVNEDYSAEIKNLAGRIRSSTLFHLSDQIDVATERFQRNSNALLLFESLLNAFANGIEIAHD